MSTPDRRTWTAETAAWLAHLAAEATTASTVAARRQHLNRAAEDMPGTSPYAITGPELAAWLNASAPSRHTWQNRLTTLRRFYQWAQDTGRTTADPTAGLTVRDCPHAPAQARRRPGPAPRPAPTGAWGKAIGEYLQHLVTAAVPATTRTTYRSRLYQLAQHFEGREPWEVTGTELVDWMAGRDLGRDARRGTRATLTGFYDWAVDTGRTSTNPARQLPRIKARPGLPRPIPDHLLTQAYDVADERTRMILRLAAEAGLRRTEIATVHAHDVHHTPDGYALLVHGKGQKQRMIPITESLARLIGTGGDSWLLPNGNGGHLTPGVVSRLASRVLPEPYTLHTLRHRFATTAYARCRDLYAVQRLLGHANPQITQRYVSLDTATLRPVVASLDPTVPVAMPGGAHLTAVAG
ncbi:tyrosine-type recombinase/integrase [Citricoccus sp. NPDC055426]|uniref:tyrosine-type recombinase/integrase n=1 Tax=Citricoccus sp. NPDC055426 TaxID=3155536 RepID=UPI0034169052